MIENTFKHYDWAMYVDASGDDGFAFERGSSAIYTVNCFMCKTESIPYNQDVLHKIKAIFRCAPNIEMKSSTIIKSKKRSVVCDMLSTLEGIICQFVVFKKYIDPDSFSEEQKSKHYFTSLVHGFSIRMAATFHQHYHQSLCIIIDNMKAEAVLGTKEVLETYLKDIDYRIIFSDSKSSVHSLLQVSDYLAGLTNKAFTEHETLISHKPSINRCAPCRIIRHLCHNNPNTIQSPLFYDVQRYINIFALWSNQNPAYVMGNGIRVYPDSFALKYRFFDCVALRSEKSAKK